MRTAKQQSAVTKFLTGVFVFALLVSTTSAETINGGKAPPAENPLHVEYIGVDNNYLVFEVTVVTDSLKNSELMIGDASGSLYTQGFNGSITEKVKIEKNDDQVLSFKVKEGKKLFSKLFTVNTEAVENTTVSENTYVVR